MREDLSLRYETAARSALQSFGIEAGELRLHLISENVTFRVVNADDGRVYALRLHRPGYRSLEELQSEHYWTAALRSDGLPVPRACVSLAGSAYVRVSIEHDGEYRYAGLSEWLPGNPLSAWIHSNLAAPAPQRVMTAIGELLARMHRHAGHWRPPNNFTRPQWDADALLGSEPKWGRFWEHPALTADERRTLVAARTHLHRLLCSLDKNENHYGMIHSDVHADNVLIDGNRVSIIDFDDAAHGWFCYDIAVALQPHVEHADYAAWRAALLTGYRRTLAFDAADEKLLDTFILVRDLAYIGWYLQRPEVEGRNAGHSLAIRNRALSSCRAL